MTEEKKTEEVEVEEVPALGEPGGPKPVEHPKPIEGDSSESVEKSEGE